MSLFGINSNIKYSGSKSFFAHRNQFAIFLYIAIISNMFLIMKYGKIRYILPLIVLGINLLLTASRTGILCTAIFIFLFFVTTPKIKIRYKILIFLICAVLFGISVKVIYEQYPDIAQKVEKVFIRSQSIKNFTGRSDIWKIGINLINKDDKTLAFGVGRFIGIKALEGLQNGNITQFHSFYVDMLVTGGIMELVYLISIYLVVIVKVLKSKMDKKFKFIYVSAFLSYAVYCLCESLGRFSIGCADTVCLIMFISIPLLHANSIQEKKKIVLKTIEIDNDIENENDKDLEDKSLENDINLEGKDLEFEKENDINLEHKDLEFEKENDINLEYKDSEIEKENDIILEDIDIENEDIKVEKGENK